MPGVQIDANGACGTLHGINFRVADPERLCVNSARLQLLVADALLSEGAGQAKRIIAGYKPVYPSVQAYFEAVDQLFLDKDAVVVSVTKGLEAGTQKRMSEVVAEETGHRVVVLTGPSHAEEVALDVPTACLSASENRDDAEFVQDAFMADNFRIYTSHDPVGAELGAALKNVIALCAGISDGLGCGDNTKAMLMTRGLTEMARLGVSLGASKDTFAGLAGVGDLIVTCTSMHSRNRRAGILIGQGKTAKQAMEEVGAVVEGYYAAQSAWELCQKQGIEMPILHAAYDVLYNDVPARQAFGALLHRPRKTESEDAGWL